MLQLLGIRNKASSKRRTKDEDTPERLSEEVTVYISKYGTQYALPTDKLFSREEKRQLLEDTQKRAANAARTNGKA